MSELWSTGNVVAALAGKAGKLFGRTEVLQFDGSRIEAYDLAGVDVLSGQNAGGFQPEPLFRSSRTGGPRSFDIGTLLRLRTFVYLVVGTALFLFQIYNTLSIKELAIKNEKLREQLRISTSITTAQELRAKELQSVRSISGYARQLDLESPPVPPVEIEP
jgi:hypothetical protein